MKITDSGAHLSPWRRRVLPLMMMALRALVAWVVLRSAVDLLLHNALFLAGQNLRQHLPVPARGDDQRDAGTHGDFRRVNF